MTAKNDITGDAIQSIPTKAYQDNFDAIFRKHKESKESQLKDLSDKVDSELYNYLLKDDDMGFNESIKSGS